MGLLRVESQSLCYLVRLVVVPPVSGRLGVLGGSRMLCGSGVALRRRIVPLRSLSRLWSLMELRCRVVLGGFAVHPIRMRVVLRVPPVPVLHVRLRCELLF